MLVKALIFFFGQSLTMFFLVKVLPCFFGQSLYHLPTPNQTYLSPNHFDTQRKKKFKLAMWVKQVSHDGVFTLLG